MVTTVAGSGSAGYADGSGLAALFNGPSAIAVGPSNHLYVADQNNCLIRKIDPSGLVTTLAGSGSYGYVDSNGVNASFSVVTGIAVDPNGTVYVADQYNHCIRKITPSGLVSTLAGNRSQGFADLNGASASFALPSGLALDGSGNIIVGDAVNARVRKITPAGAVSTIAGSSTTGYGDGQGAAAVFLSPFGIAVDASGQIFVVDWGNRNIRLVDNSKYVSTYAGHYSSMNFLDATYYWAVFKSPTGVAVDSSGQVFVADAGNHRIRKISP